MSPPLLASQAAAEVKRRLAEALGERLLEVRIFGSMARGEAHEASDLDLLVLVSDRDLDLDNQVYAIAYEVYATLQCPFIVAPLIMTRTRLDELTARERLIARDLENEGIRV